MHLVLLLMACGSLDAGKDQGKVLPSDGTPGSTDPDAAARVLVETPTPGAFLDVGPVTVTGVATQVSDPALGGAPVSVSGGDFASDETLQIGMNTYEVTGARSDGLMLRDHSSVLAGEFAAPDGIRAKALQAYLSDEGLDALVPLVGDLLDPAELSASLTALNPVVSTPDTTVNLTGLTFDPPVITVDPVTDRIDLEIRIPNFVLGIEATIADALPFGIDLTLTPDLKADEVVIHTHLEVDVDGQGGLVATLGEMDVELVEFDLDTGILELVDWLFIDDQDLAVMLEGQLAGMGSAFQPTIDEMLALVDDLDLELDLLGTLVTVQPWFEDVAVSPDGIGVEVGVAMDAVGAEKPVPGHLTLGPPGLQTDRELSLQISDDFLNRALFELWAGGALDIELPLGAEDATVLFLFGGKDEGHLSMVSDLPPVWIEKGGEARLQLGEIHLSVDTPGGDYGDKVEVIMALDARAEISLTSEAFGIVLSDANIVMRPTGDSVGNEALIDFLPGMATAFGIGIGVVNELLTFPLIDLLGPDLVLPELAFDRDPSGLGTLVDVPVEDVIGVLTGTLTPGSGTGTGTGTGTTPPPVTGPVVVPSTATVHSEDGTVTDDNHEGWICERDDIDAEGDNGTWYLQDNGHVVLIGTGHTVYAVDGSDVTLESAGNTVYYDPGANIDDQDGTNTLIEVDPLELDLTSAPVPGC